MAKTDKLYKVLRIVLVTLAIMGVVFGLMKKVGLCAASSDSVITSLPFPVGPGYGNNYTSSELNTIISVIEDDMESANDPDYSSIGIIIPGEIDSTYTRFRVFSSPIVLLFLILWMLLLLVLLFLIIGVVVLMPDVVKLF